MSFGDSYSDYLTAAGYVLDRIGFKPEVGVILGTGLGSFAADISNAVTIEYSDIPGFPVSTVEGHAGRLVCGKIDGKTVACMAGRFHYYEGYEFEELTASVRLFRCLGCKVFIQTNAAGAVNAAYAPGDIMIVRDHIKLYGGGPTRGRNIDEFGPRFFDVQKMYTPELRALALKCSEGSGLKVHEGVYFYTPGPQFETPAEINAIRILGGDAVGMSTVCEALTAAHCSMPCLTITLISNMAAGMKSGSLSLEEVIDTGDSVAVRFSAYIRKIIAAV